MEKPDIDGLKAFVARTDRDTAEFFVGRKAEIAKAEEVVALTRADMESGLPSQSRTLLFKGAPGAGKTSLLNHLRERLGRQSAENEAAAPVIVDVYLEDIADSAQFVEAVAYGIGKEVDREFRTERTSGAGIGANWLEFLGMSLRGSRAKTTSSPSLTLYNLAEAVQSAGIASPVVLLFDEIQAADPGAHGAVLRALHKGRRNLPIVPVLAGLGQSRDVLSECRLTRLSVGQDFTLDCLEQAEARQAVEEFMERFRIEATPPARSWWADELARRSDGWPQHLHTALQGLAEQLIAAEGVLAAVDPDAAFDAGLSRRLASYKVRRSNEMADARFLVTVLMRGMPDRADAAIDRGEVANRLQQLHSSAPKDDVRYRLPEGMTAQQFREHLVHRGALQYNEDRNLYCPIPSFRRWLIEQGGEEPNHQTFWLGGPEASSTDRLGS